MCFQRFQKEISVVNGLWVLSVKLTSYNPSALLASNVLEIPCTYSTFFGHELIF